VESQKGSFFETHHKRSDDYGEVAIADSPSGRAPAWVRYSSLDGRIPFMIWVGIEGNRVAETSEDAH
jgi:hypothetical protein